LRNSIKAEIEVSGGFGEIKGGGTSSFNKEINRASSQNRLTIQATATGGRDFGSIAPLVELAGKSKPLEGIGESLKLSLENFKPLPGDKPIPALAWKYDTRLLADDVRDSLKFDPRAVPSWSSRKQDQLHEMKINYDRVKIDIEAAKDIIAGKDLRAKIMTKDRDPSVQGLYSGSRIV
jgi:hypothetical protein